MEDFSKTDLEKFIELYKSFGINCKIAKNDNGDNIIKLCGSGSYMYEDVTKSELFDGYNGFYSDIIFDKNGKFLK